MKTTILIVQLSPLALALLLFTTLASNQAQAQNLDDTVTVSNKAINNDPQQEALKRPERVTVVAPKYLRPQSDYHVLVNLANSVVPASIDLQLTGARDSNREQIEAKSVLANSGETQTVKFAIGDWPLAEYILSVTAQAIDRSWNFTQETILNYHAKSFLAFIQTDKAIYKPGQLVQFRTIFLTQNLTPLVLKEEINVTIYDPRRNIIKQWNGMSNWRGLLSLDFQLSDDPMLGDWSIKVETRKQEITKKFQLAEYILPTFDVSIQLPGYATYNESDIVATVRASYTYGKPVKGHVTLTVQPLVRFAQIDTQPLQQAQYRTRLENGSADISLDVVKDLKQTRDLFEREIEFFALVEEDLTGRKYNKTQVMKIHDKSVKIEQINTDETFKPGLSYLLQLKVAYQDDTPVEDSGPELELIFTTLGRTLNSTKLRPQNGVVEHTIEVPKEVASLQSQKLLVTPGSIELKAIYRGQVHYLNSISPYMSESEEYMQISLPQLQARNKQALNRNKKSSQLTATSTVNINDDLKVKVRATEGMYQVTCQGLARGDIIWALSPDAKNQSEFEFDVKVDQRMAPEARILCFYIRPQNKEMIADSVSVLVNGLMRNVVKLSTSREEAKPGQEVEVGVFTKPNSLVGVLGIDQSVLLLKSGNDISQQDVTNEIKSYSSSSSSRRNFATNTDQLFDNADVVVLTNNLIHSGFHFRSGKLLYKDGDALYMLATSRIALSPVILDHEISPPEFHINKPQKDGLVIRSFFPETWLWENATAGQDGIAHFKAKMPDTITSWILSAFSISENSGFGLSTSKTSIRVFRPFFIKLNLPYSIIRGETVNIQAIIFNYSKRPTSAKVILENRNGEFEFVEAGNSLEEESRSGERFNSRLIRIPAQDGVSVSFLITPRKLGPIDIRVTAQSEFAGDGLVKKLLVKPEGQTQYLNKALLINLASPIYSSPSSSSSSSSSSSNQSTNSTPQLTRNFSIEVPANAVPGSRKVFVSVVGDIMGAGLSNVDDLLRLPYGCGEQNMINLVPNIVILNYLQSTKRLRDTQRIRAVRNIETGYQRQLNYMRSDGSFSAFGQSDTNGSIWLTAYVLKTFQQAKTIVTVDEKIIRRTANFIARYSHQDGSIEEVGMLHNKALQSLGSNSASTYLTAYSMIALLQKQIAPDSDAPAPVALDEVLENGLNFLEKKLDDLEESDNPYELAIITYALHLANRPTANKAYDKLWSKAQEDGELGVWWENKQTSLTNESDGKLSSLAEYPDKNNEGLEREFESINNKPSIISNQQPPLKPLPVNTKHSAHLFVPDSLSIEMTSFALLTTVKRGELDRAFPIVKWLVSQQNSNGGFASTQDTVLAIEALATFADANSISRSPLSLDIELVSPRDTKRPNSSGDIRRNNVDQLLITQSNALVNQQIRLSDNVTWVQLKAIGSGSAVAQLSWQYNLIVSAEKPAFYLNPILDKTSNINYLQLSICTYYKAGDASNMAVMEVELPSGYVADVEALPGLKQSGKDIKRIDTVDGDTKVFIYIDKVTRDEICLTVPAHRTSKVSNNKPVPVSIYDYYNRQQAARIFYVPQTANSCDICDSNNCKEICSESKNKQKKSDRLISLHEQRKIIPTTTNSTHANLTSNVGPGSASSVNSKIQLLPLAPVLVSILAVARGLY